MSRRPHIAAKTQLPTLESITEGGRVRREPGFRARRGLLLTLVAVAAAACGKPQGLPPKGPSNVTVITTSAHDTPVFLEFVAQTQSSRQVNIQARVNGFLDRRVYTEGSMVKEGQVLFLMDRKPFQAQLDAAKAALERQEAAMKVAQQNLQRTKPLVEQNALSLKDLDDATGQFEQAAAATEQAKAQVTSAELNLSYTTITSPVAGVSSYAQQADGTYLSPSNSQLTTVAVLSPMWVNFSVSENVFQTLRENVEKGVLKPAPEGKYEVEILLVDGTVFPQRGHITFTQPEYNSNTGTFLVRASVDNAQGLLRPNQYVRARVHGAIRPNAILVPQRAVQQGSKGSFVWMVDKENKVQERPVTVGPWHGDQWFITEGVQSGEQVVVDGALTLTPGAQVHPTPYTGQAAAAPAAAAPAAGTASAAGGTAAKPAQ
jgi:membrane fusion protein, multidrug efflux system